MNEEYLILLENIRDTLEDIKALQEELSDLLGNPDIAAEKLEEIRNTLNEIRELRSDA